MSEVRRVIAVTGACLLVPRALFAELGGFDTAYLNSFEDIDLCLRLGERGYEVHYCHESVLYHLECATRTHTGQDEHANAATYRERWAHRVRPDDVHEHMNVIERGIALEEAWEKKVAVWSAKYPVLREDWDQVHTGKPRPGYTDVLPEFPAGEDMATRDAGKKVMQAFKHHVPTMVGGAADLVESTKTEFEGGGLFSAMHAGRNIAFGIREHAMGSIVNGISAHGGMLITRRLQEWACLLGRDFPFGTAQRLLGWQAGEEQLRKMRAVGASGVVGGSGIIPGIDELRFARSRARD